MQPFPSRSRQKPAIPAPKDGRAKTRIGWLLWQLKDVPSDLRVIVHYPRTGTDTSLMIEAARERPQDLLLPDAPKRAPSGFGLARVGGLS